MSTQVLFKPQAGSMDEPLETQLGSFLECIPVGDWDRVTQIYDHSRPLSDGDSGLDKVGVELGILWKGLKHTLPEQQLDKCFKKLIIIVIEGDMLSLLRSAHTDIKANIHKADKSREQLIKAAVTSCLDEAHYLENWVDGKTLSSEIVEFWERFYGVDIFEAVKNGHGSERVGKGVDPIGSAREVMSLNLVKAVPVIDYDDLLARILSKLMGGIFESNRGMIRRHRRRREQA